MAKIRITKEPEERRKEILNAAIKVFSEKVMKNFYNRYCEVYRYSARSML